MLNWKSIAVKIVNIRNFTAESGLFTSATKKKEKEEKNRGRK
jgi:hypothetical protein